MAKAWATAAILSAAAAATNLLLPSPGIAQLRAPTTPVATQPAAGQTDVPVKQVVLFSSGVGYFEHFGSVTGDGSTELRFKTDQINDVLKSLVLQDLDKGQVGTVSYPSQEPIGKTLKSFQIDITANPPLADLLNQLRGARVELTLADGPVHGTVVGVEAVWRPRPGKAEEEVTIGHRLNLKVGKRFRVIPLETVLDFALEDPKLDQEMEQALSALAGARDQDKKPVTINFRGRGERRVRMGYVVETPIWKTSYRLVLTEAASTKGSPATQPGTRAAGEGTKPTIEDWARVDPTMEGHAKLRSELTLRVDGLTKQLGSSHPAVVASREDLATRQAYMGRYAEELNQKFVLHRNADGTAVEAAPRQPGGAGQDPGGKLQGWAIVENQTDNDWTDVQLSLVSGRPISFIQDLYHPLYVPRPVVQPELYASLRPQTYQGGISVEDEEKLEEDRTKTRVEAERQAGRSAGGGGGGGSGGGALFAGGGKDGWHESGGSPAPMDPAASVASAASAGQLGELFEYTVGNVSLARQRSAMIPIVTDDVEVEKLSIYNQEVLERNPLNGVRVKNTTKKHLLQGPVTVLEAGGYAGDARIDDVPPGQQRLLSYGIDLNVTCDPSDSKGESAVQTAKIVKGVLEVTSKEVSEQTYVFQNKGDQPRTIIVEHRREPESKLVQPASAEETTESLYRLRTRVEAGKTTKLPVRLETVGLQQVAILTSDVEPLLLYSRTGEIPEPVRKALAEVVRRKQALVATQQQLEERNGQIKEFSTEQARIRENMKTVAPTTDYYTRLLQKLGDQETQIERLQKETAELRKAQEQQKKELEEFVMTVG